MPNILSLDEDLGRVLERRITAYTVKWGKPYGALDYHEYIVSINPKVYVRMTLDGTNWGTTYGNNFGFDNVTQSKSLLGYPESIALLSGVGSGAISSIDKIVDSQYAFSLSLWLNTSRASGTMNPYERQVVVAKSDVNGADEFIVALSHENTVQVYLRGTLVLDTVGENEGVLIASNTYHLGVTYSRSSGVCAVYVNGKAIKQVENVNVPSVTTSAKLSVGAITYDGQTFETYSFRSFQGKIESVAVFPSVLGADVLLRHYRIGSSATYYDPSNDLDTAPVTAVSTGLKWDDFVESLAPTHWWDFDTQPSAPYRIPGRGTVPLQGEFSSQSAAENKPSAVVTEGASKHSKSLNRFHRFTSYGNIFGGATQVTPFTVAFWLRLSRTSREEDELFSLGNTANVGLRSGCALTFQTISGSVGRFRFHKRDVTNGTMRTVEHLFSGVQYVDLNDTGDGGWLHIAASVTSYGLMKLYINGTLVVSGVSPDGAGVNMARIGEDTNFRLAHEYVYQDLPRALFDEPMVWDRALDDKDVRALYMVGRYGSAYADTRVSGSVTGGSVIGYSISDDPMTTLVDPRDVTGFVVDYSTEDSLDKLVGTAVLTAVDKDGFESLKKAMPPMSYVVIEERRADYLGEGGAEWESVGHYLVDGPVANTVDGSGGDTYRIALRTLPKILTLDRAIVEYVPDRIHVERALMRQHRVANGVIEFELPRIDFPEERYGNWAETPSIRLYLSEFQNPDNPNNMPSEVRLKGAGSSVEVLGGKGIVRVDADYYTDKLPNGLGNPDPIKGVRVSLDRYVTDFKPFSDIVEGVTISDIFLEDSVWCVRLSGLNGRPFGRTAYALTGACRGRKFGLDVKHSTGAYVSKGNPTQATQSGSGISWSDVDRAYFKDGFPTKAVRQSTGLPAFTNTLHVTGFGFTPRRNAVVKGVVVEVVRRAYYRQLNNWYFSSWGQGATVSESEVYLTFNGVNSGNNQAWFQRPPEFYLADPTRWETVEYGGSSSLWGNTSIDASAVPNIGVAIKADFNGLATAEIDSVRMIVHYDDGSTDDAVYTIRDSNGLTVNPHMAGLQIGDEFRLGNANRPLDVFLDILYGAGFQGTDPSKPFYVSLDPIEFDEALGWHIPPFRTNADDAWTRDQILTELLQYVPPNYVIRCHSDGVTRGTNIVQKKTPDIVLDTVTEVAEDPSDYNVYTRVVASGIGGDSINVAESSLSAVRAIKMDNFARSMSGQRVRYDQNTDGFTYPKTDQGYALANAIVKQITDFSQRTPDIMEPIRDNPYANLGNIWVRRGPNLSYWDMADEDLFVLDVGRNVEAGTEYEIEALQLTHFKTIKEGAGVSQSLFVWYMTESDYISSVGSHPPEYPSQEGADKADSYMPPDESPFWRLLVDEFNCTEGQTTIEANSFEGGRPVKARFFKVQLGQAHYYEDAVDKNLKMSRINLADFKAFTSRRIVATATLGVTPPYETVEMKGLLGRVRVRTVVLPMNYYLDTYSKGANFAADQLGELIRDFAPSAVSGRFPVVQPGQTCSFRDPRNGAFTSRLIVAISRTSDGLGVAQVVDYDSKA